MAIWESLLWPDPAMPMDQLGAHRYAACLMLSRLSQLVLGESRDSWRRAVFLAKHIVRSPE